MWRLSAEMLTDRDWCTLAVLIEISERDRKNFAVDLKKKFFADSIINT